MKKLTKDVFIHKGKKTGNIRIWHNCHDYKKGKGRGIYRVELEKISQDKDAAKYKCRHCGFEYTLDLHLNI